MSDSQPGYPHEPTAGYPGYQSASSHSSYQSSPGYQPPSQQSYQQGYQQGYQQPGGAPVYGQKSRMAAGLLAIFLGSLGIHNFYLGFTGKAVAQLLITVLSFGFLAWISWVWALVEGILYLTGEGKPEWSYDAKGVPLAS